MSDKDRTPVDPQPRHGKYFSKHLINGSDGNMNIDGSVTPVDFTLSPPSGKKYIISLVMLVMEDGLMTYNTFGGITALINGVRFRVTESGIQRDLLDYTIKDNFDFYELSASAGMETRNTDVLICSWKFIRAGTVLELKNLTSDNFKVTIQDDLTDISKFVCILQGYEVDE